MNAAESSTPSSAPPPIPYIHGISAPQHPSALPLILLFTAAIVIILAGGAYVYTSYISNREAKLATLDTNIAETGALAQMALEREWLEAAIKKQIVILGMNRNEVLMARGRPNIVQKGPDLHEAFRKIGGVECWIYEMPEGNRGVTFGMDGLVIYSTDASGKPKWGYVIREPKLF